MGDQSAVLDMTKASPSDIEEIQSDFDDVSGDDDDDYNYEGFDDMMAEAAATGAEADDAMPLFFYETLWADDIYKDMMDAVRDMAEVVNLPQDDVLCLLGRYDWDTARFQVRVAG